MTTDFDAVKFVVGFGSKDMEIIYEASEL